MAKVLRSLVRGPLEPHASGFAEELLRQGCTRSAAEQHMCFITQLDRCGLRVLGLANFRGW